MASSDRHSDRMEASSPVDQWWQCQRVCRTLQESDKFNLTCLGLNRIATWSLWILFTFWKPKMLSQKYYSSQSASWIYNRQKTSLCLRVQKYPKINTTHTKQNKARELQFKTQCAVCEPFSVRVTAKQRRWKLIVQGRRNPSISPCPCF